jgi:hypothetical protein
LSTSASAARRSMSAGATLTAASSRSLRIWKGGRMGLALSQPGGLILWQPLGAAACGPPTLRPRRGESGGRAACVSPAAAPPHARHAAPRAHAAPPPAGPPRAHAAAPLPLRLLVCLLGGRQRCHGGADLVLIQRLLRDLRGRRGDESGWARASLVRRRAARRGGRAAAAPEAAAAARADTRAHVVRHPVQGGRLLRILSILPLQLLRLFVVCHAAAAAEIAFGRLAISSSRCFDVFVSVIGIQASTRGNLYRWERRGGLMLPPCAHAPWLPAAPEPRRFRPLRGGSAACPSQQGRTMHFAYWGSHSCLDIGATLHQFSEQ